MAKQAGLNTWLHRATNQFLINISSGGMEIRFSPEVFHDGSGEPISNANWIHAPGLTAVAGFNSQHWIITGDVVTLMSLAQRNQVDADAIAAQKQAEKDAATADINTNTDRRLLGFMETMVDEINILRQAASISPARTIAGYKTNTKSNIGNQ